MNLPDVIQIRPVTVPLHSALSIPGSKSLTNRSLVLAALATGETRLEGALWSEDTELMTHALLQLGFFVRVQPDPGNECNRILTVRGEGGKIPRNHGRIHVGTAGTVARFLSAFCALGQGNYGLSGSERMHERPMREIFDALRKCGVQIRDTDGRLPAAIQGPIRAGTIEVSDVQSSQFASALLLISKVAGLEVVCPSSPYVEMTRQLMKEWEVPATVRSIEADASSASYFVALEKVLGGTLNFQHPIPTTSTQIDQRIGDSKFWPPRNPVSRKTDLGDSIMTLVVSAAAKNWPLKVMEASKLREQECDRITALVTELKKCGVQAGETPDTLELKPPATFRSARIHTYKDHRMAMCFGLLGCVDVLGDGKPWITLEDPECVNKTFPNFFKTLESVARQSYQAANKPFEGCVVNPDGTPLFPSK